MIEKKELQRHLDNLNELWGRYYTADAKTKKEIRGNAYMHGNRLPDDLYITLNNGAASGLFSYDFFESDVSRASKMLEDMIKNIDK